MVVHNLYSPYMAVPPSLGLKASCPANKEVHCMYQYLMSYHLRWIYNPIHKL